MKCRNDFFAIKSSLTDKPIIPKHKIISWGPWVLKTLSNHTKEALNQKHLKSWIYKNKRILGTIIPIDRADLKFLTGIVTKSSMWRTHKKPFNDWESKRCWNRFVIWSIYQQTNLQTEAGNSNIVSSATNIKTTNISDTIHHHLMFCQILMFFGIYSKFCIWIAHSNFLHELFFYADKETCKQQQFFWCLSNYFVTKTL